MPTSVTSGASRSRPPGSARLAGAADQLLRPGRAGAADPARRSKIRSTGWRPRFAAAAGRAGDRGHRDREPGGHHRRLLAGASGDATRPAAAARDAAHLGRARGPDLPAAREHLLLIGVLLLVLLFRTSSALASAYGIAVTTTMVVDGLLACRGGSCGTGALWRPALRDPRRRHRRRGFFPPTCSSCSKAPGRRSCSA